MALFPKGSPLTQTESDFSPLSVVMYENDGNPLLAAVLEFRKSRYVLLNQRGREAELTADRLYPFRTKIPAEHKTIQARATYLSELYEQSLNAGAGISLKEVWGFVAGEEKDYTCQDLCDLYFGNLDYKNHIALRLALLNDRIFFKRKKESFTPRSQEIIAELTAAEEVRLKKAEMQELAVKALSARKKDPGSEIPSGIMPVLELLEEIAADGEEVDHSKQKEAKEFLTLCAEKAGFALSGSHSEKAYSLLRAIGYFDRTSNLSLIRHRPPVIFSDGALKEAGAVNPDEKSAGRLDLTALGTFTIDDHATKDMDDAISIEQTGGGYRLGIHISDVASLVMPGTRLDEEAKLRCTSLYMADRTINMLPEELSQDKLSLVKDSVRPVISYLFEIDRSFNVIGGEIKAACIKVSRRLGYEEANHLLEGDDHDFGVLHNIAATREIYRYEKGGAKVNKRDALPVLTPDGEITLQEIDEDSPGRALVSELAVLANELSAEFAVKNKIPLVYRSQEAPDPSSGRSVSRIPPGPAQDYALRGTLKKSITSLFPGPHSSLGLDAYCQATSPIRRYIDLCNQRQIAGFITGGKPLYSENELRRILEDTDKRLNIANLVARESKRFWLLLYLEKYFHQKKIITGTIVRNDLKTPMVELDEVYIMAPLKTKKQAVLGEKVQMRIAAITPHFDFIRLEAV